MSVYFGRSFFPKCLMYLLDLFQTLHFSPKDGACGFSEEIHNLSPKEEASYPPTFPNNLKYLPQRRKEEENI